MKKILFVVCTHGNELAGFNIFINHPYGQVGDVTWETIIGNPLAMTLNQRFIDTDLNRSFDTEDISSYEERRAAILKERFKQYDVVYDIHTTSAIKPAHLDDCIFINKNNPETLKACAYVNAKHIIWDSNEKYQKQYLTAHHPIGITLEYQKTSDYFNDVNRIRNDFYNIAHQEKNTNKQYVYEADRPVTHEEKEKYALNFQDFHLLNAKEKTVLKLNPNEEYAPFFTNGKDIDPHHYCFLNKKIT